MGIIIFLNLLFYYLIQIFSIIIINGQLHLKTKIKQAKLIAKPLISSIEHSKSR